MLTLCPLHGALELGWTGPKSHDEVIPDMDTSGSRGASGVRSELN